MKRKLRCRDCGFKKDIEDTPHKELKSKDIIIKGSPTCDKCGSENTEII